MSEQIENIVLKPKHLKFCDAILQGKTQDEAYLIAGYKAKNGNVARVSSSKLLTNCNISHYLELQRKKLQENLERKTEISKEWVLNKYKEVAERCAQEIEPVLNRKGEPVMVKDKEGNLKQAYIFNAKGVVAALDGIARVQGYNAPQKHEVAGTLEHIVREMPADQRKERIMLLQNRLTSVETHQSN